MTVIVIVVLQLLYLLPYIDLVFECIFNIIRFDYILIESTGISEPMQVAETFCLDPENATAANAEGVALTSEDMLFHRYAKLDTCVTVIDAKEFPSILKSTQTYAERFPQEMVIEEIYESEENARRSAQPYSASNAEGEKHISQLLVEQVEFANVIVVNKMDLLVGEEGENEKQELEHLLKTLNPSARIILTAHGQIELRHILNTGLFDLQEASQAAGWLQSLANGHVLVSEREEYNISSYVYRARRPFHPARLAMWLQESLGWKVFDTWKGLSPSFCSPLCEREQDTQRNGKSSILEIVHALQAILIPTNSESYATRVKSFPPVGVGVGVGVWACGC